MNLSENISQALGNVRSNWVRAVLTLMIIAFGIMALVGILTAIDSVVYSLSDNFSNMGANSFNITPRGSGVRGHRGKRRAKIGDIITFKDALDFKKKYQFPARTSIYFRGTGIATIKYGKEKTNPNVRVYGVDDNYLFVKSYEVEHGRDFSDTEQESATKKAIIGQDVVKLLFEDNPEYALGKSISVGNLKYNVIGVLKSKGSSMNTSGDRLILVPLLNAKNVYASARTNYSIAVSIGAGAEMENATAAAIGTFRNIRKIRLGQEEDFEIFKSDGLIDILKENTFTLRMATIAIALMTLLGAAIGLMNIMLVSVTERTREIGICKALGATRESILTQFLTEAIVICQLGGILGIILGVIIGFAVSIAMKGPFYIPWVWILLGFVVCLVVGLISGIYPALKASRLDPIESLRYE